MVTDKQKANLTNAGKGRKKGSKNKATKLRDDFIEAFYLMGGVQGFADWLQKEGNEKLLEQYYMSFLPNHIFPKDNPVEGDEGGGSRMIYLTERYIVKPGGSGKEGDNGDSPAT